MKKLLFAIAMIACTCMAANAGHTIYVSTTGNDAVADGSAAKPYYSLQQAINKAVAVSGTDTVTVDVQPGIYTVQQTISVTQSPKTPLLVRCLDNEPAVMSGAIAIGNWQQPLGSD